MIRKDDITFSNTKSIKISNGHYRPKKGFWAGYHDETFNQYYKVFFVIPDNVVEIYPCCKIKHREI